MLLVPHHFILLIKIQARVLIWASDRHCSEGHIFCTRLTAANDGGCAEPQNSRDSNSSSSSVHFRRLPSHTK